MPSELFGGARSDRDGVVRRRLAIGRVQAIANAPERTWQDLADIRHLLALAGVDLEEARGYFDKAGLLARWEDLRGGQ